jgi:hypothetical protein
MLCPIGSLIWSITVPRCFPDQGRRLVTTASAHGLNSPPEDHRDSVTLV